MYIVISRMVQVSVRSLITSRARLDLAKDPGPATVMGTNTGMFNRFIAKMLSGR